MPEKEGNLLAGMFNSGIDRIAEEKKWQGLPKIESGVELGDEQKKEFDGILDRLFDMDKKSKIPEKTKQAAKNDALAYVRGFDQVKKKIEIFGSGDVDKMHMVYVAGIVYGLSQMSDAEVLEALRFSGGSLGDGNGGVDESKALTLYGIGENNETAVGLRNAGGGTWLDTILGEESVEHVEGEVVDEDFKGFDATENGNSGNDETVVDGEKVVNQVGGGDGGNEPPEDNTPDDETEDGGDGENGDEEDDYDGPEFENPEIQKIYEQMKNFVNLYSNGLFAKADPERRLEGYVNELTKLKVSNTDLLLFREEVFRFKSELGIKPNVYEDLDASPRFKQFLGYALEQDFEGGDLKSAEVREKFQDWFRHWMYRKFYSKITKEMTATTVNANEAISVSLDYSMKISQVIEHFPNKPLNGDPNEISLREFANGVLEEVRVFATLHNRGMLYEGSKGDPTELAKAMIAMDGKSAGPGQPLEMNAKTYQVLARAGMVEVGETGEKVKFAEMFRKALSVYLYMSPWRNKGCLFKKDFVDMGFEESEVDRVVDSIDGNLRQVSFKPNEVAKGYLKEGKISSSSYGSGEITLEVAMRNIFPEESVGSSGEYEAARKVIQELVGGGSMGKLAEYLAHKYAVQAGIGAHLDYGAMAMDAGSKLDKTGYYRSRQIKQSKPAGNPITVPFFGSLCRSYVDAIRIGQKGEVRTLRQWFLDWSVPVEEIPWNSMPAKVDSKYYANEFNWSAKMFEYLLNGTKIDWANLTITGNDGQGPSIKPQYPEDLRQLNKYISYWIGSLDLDFLYDAIDPTHSDDGVNAIWEARKKGELDDDDVVYLLRVAALSNIVFSEIELHGAGYNPQATIWGSIKGQAGRSRLEQRDVRMILQLLCQETKFEDESGNLYSMFTEKQVEAKLAEVRVLGVQGALSIIWDAAVEIAKLNRIQVQSSSRF